MSEALIPSYSAVLAITQNLQDFIRAPIQAGTVGILKGQIESLLLDSFGTALDQQKAGAEGDAGKLLNEILRIYGGLYDNWSAGILQGMGTAYSGAMESFLQSGQLLYAYKTLMYNISVTPRMRRHWNRVFLPSTLDTRTAFQAFMENEITLKQYLQYAAWEGWSEKDATTLMNVWDREPDPWTAFNMQLRGSITAEERDAAYKVSGYMEKWHKALTESMMYVPSPYELARMADFVELDQIWALDMLKKRGLSEKDRAKMWEFIQIRPLREEVRALTTEWGWRYRYGRCTHDELTNALDGLGIKPKEKALLVQNAELHYQDELVDEMIVILQWRFRTAKITEEEFLQGLLDLNIREEKANLIVETELAKGYLGYY